MLANDGPVRQRLESVASEVSKAVDKELQASPEEGASVYQGSHLRSVQGDYWGQEGNAELRPPTLPLCHALLENWLGFFSASFDLDH